MGTLRQLNYPSMERQDLTQGQLGSFKFTPIDNPVHHGTPQVNTLGDTPLLLQAQARLRGRFEQEQALEGVAWNNKQTGSDLSPSKSGNRYNNSSFTSALSYSSQPQSPHSLCDPTFFNTHIKPDLEDSRLKLGPAAFRSAVQSNSPERTFSHQQASNARFSSSVPILPRSRFLRSVMNPEARSFEPTMSSSDSDHHDPELLNKTLCHALIDEQEAHQETQEHLRQTLLKLEGLEADLNAALADNKSLLASVNLLGRIIKHNASRLEKKGEAGNKDISKFSRPTASSQLPKHADSQPLVIQDQTTKVCPFTEDAQSQSSNLVKQVSPASDHSKLFNLDLLKNRDSTDFNSARLSRTLRKHFSVDETSSVGSDTGATTADNVNSINELIHLSPQSPPKMEPLPKIDEVAILTNTALMGEQVLKDFTSGRLRTAEDALLELPASFLNKYSAAGKKAKIEEKQEEVVFDTPPIGCDASNDSRSSVSEPQIKEVEGYKAPDQKISPLDLSIKWKVTKENPIYDDEDKARALSNQQRGSHNQVFWKHPVRFLEHGENDKNIFRTVMIDYIPTEATYQDVLRQIHGGSLEKIELVPAVGRSTDFKTARLVFNFELGASTTANYARDHGMVIKGKQVRVWQVITQTYPKNDQLDRDVFDDAFTRILVIDQATKEALDTIPDKLAGLKSSIIEFGETFDQFPMIEFTSVAAAASAMRILMSDYKFAGAVFDFDEDYCGEPYPFAY